MNFYEGGFGLPNATSGAERENFVQNFLLEIIPPQIRVGRGVIVDSFGNRSGQLDIILEHPNAMSFPLLGGIERLYPAESVVAIFEVKSNLSSQWSQVQDTIKQIAPLQRMKKGDRYPENSPVYRRIPVYVIAYQGHTSQGFQDFINNIRENPAMIYPRGILELHTGNYFGHGRGRVGQKAGGIAGLLEDISQDIEETIATSPPLSRYFNPVRVRETRFDIYLEPELHRFRHSGLVDEFHQSLSQLKPSEDISHEIENLISLIRGTKEAESAREVRAFVCGLSPPQKENLTELLSEWRKNSVATKLKESENWTLATIDISQVTVQKAEEDTFFLFEKHHMKAQEIAKDKTLWEFPAYKDNKKTKILFPRCLGTKIGHEYRLFDGIHRAILMAKKGWEQILICYYHNSKSKTEE